jgi:hypothetical protein
VWWEPWVWLHFIFLDPSLIINIYVWIWFGAFMIVTALYWNSTNINNMVITAISLFGVGTMIGIVTDIVHEEFLNGVWFIVLLGSSITAAVFFAMILGHWYLNVIALPINLLKKSNHESLGLIDNSVHLGYCLFINEYHRRYIWNFSQPMDVHVPI